MNQLDPQCQVLQKLWNKDFPMAKAMGVHILHYADHTLTTQTPLLSNTNTHGTAFAGSLYAIEALTAWGLIYLELAAAEIDASIIHASGNIEFFKPINEDIVASSSFALLTQKSAEMVSELFAELQNKGKVRFKLATQVHAKNAVAGQFSGDYVVKLNER